MRHNRRREPLESLLPLAPVGSACEGRESRWPLKNSVPPNHRNSLLIANIKSALFGQSDGVARTVQDANDHKLNFVVHVIDGVIAAKSHAQPPRERFARGRGQRKMQERFASVFDMVDEACRRRFGNFDGDIKPNLREVFFSGVGQAEGERLANSFLPLAMIFSASKLLTRPAVTSAKPLSISALSAASSSI